MRLYSPVDLTGNANMIEKLVLGGRGLEPGTFRSAAQSANLCAIKSRARIRRALGTQKVVSSIPGSVGFYIMSHVKV